MEDVTWELKNLDSLKEYIFDELIGEHKNTKDINEAINIYAERYHEIQLKLLGLHNVSGSGIPIEETEAYQQGYTEGYSKAEHEATEEIEKNYTDNSKLTDGYHNR